MSKKTFIIYGTDSDLGFLRSLANRLKDELEDAQIFALPHPPPALSEAGDFFSNHVAHMIACIENAERVIIMAHGHARCIYWIREWGAGVWQVNLLSYAQDGKIAVNLLNGKEVVLFSCFSNGDVSKRVRLAGAQGVLAFWDINTEMMLYWMDISGEQDSASAQEAPWQISGRKHAKKHLQDIISEIFARGMKEFNEEGVGLYSVVRNMRAQANKAIFRVFNWDIPEGAKGDYVRLSLEGKDAIRKSLINFRNGIRTT